MCKSCASKKDETVFSILSRIQSAEQKYQDLLKVCRSCESWMGQSFSECVSLDCHLFHERHKMAKKLILYEKQRDFVQKMSF